jgi:hypothetical protein
MRPGRPGGPVHTLSAIALLLAVLMLTSACLSLPSMIVFSPLIAVGFALFYLTVGIIRLSKAANAMTWSDLGRMLRGAAVVTYRTIVGLPTVAASLYRHAVEVGLAGVLRAVGRGLRLLLGILFLVTAIISAAPIVYALSVVLLVLVEIPYWITEIMSGRVSSVNRAISVVFPGLARRMRRTNDERRRLDAVDAQIINFWIPEMHGRPDVPLVLGQQYLGMVQVGAARPDNVAVGETAIPSADIPALGLFTEWTLWSTTVRLAAGDDRAVTFDVAEAGPDTQWMTRFSLLIPRTGESDNRNLLLIPMVEGFARIDGLVRVSGDVYREFSVRLRVVPPAESDAGGSEEPAGRPTDRAPEPVGSPQTKGRADGRMVAPDAAARSDATLVATELLVVPARDLAPKPGLSWQRPSSTLQILFLRSMAQMQSVELGPDEAETWRPDIANIESIIARSRDAANAFRSKYQDELDSITIDSITERLEAYEPRPDWAIDSPSTDPAKEQWAAAARSPELARLAYEGFALFRAIFPDGSRLTQVIRMLEPGDRLDLTWQQNGGSWVSHVPWTLLYGVEPPPPGEPIDAEQFFGLRYRIGYRAYSMGVRSRGIASESTRAHLMYWGGAATATRHGRRPGNTLRNYPAGDRSCCPPASPASPSSSGSCTTLHRTRSVCCISTATAPAAVPTRCSASVAPTTLSTRLG